MAATRSSAPVGSAQWLVSESKQADQLVRQEVEEFMFSEAQHEMEWLNAHLTDIFDQSRLNVRDVFKTPGKLRGKTPRTARKQQPLQNRAPLTDIFAPNVQPVDNLSVKGSLQKQFRDAALEDNAVKVPVTTEPAMVKIRPVKANTDSGYYGKTDDEKESDDAVSAVMTTGEAERPMASLRSEKEADERCISDASFVSAKENLGNKKLPSDQTMESSVQNTIEEDNDETIHPASRTTQEPKPEDKAEATSKEEHPEHTKSQNIDLTAVDGSPTTSDGSSPEKPLIRKSSLNFASLPAREPLTGKKSIGPQSSRPSYFNGATSRASQVARSLAGSSQESNTLIGHEAKGKKSTFGPSSDAAYEDDNKQDDEEEISAKLHDKTATQRLQDRINMLGQPREPRASKSIAPKLSFAQPSYPRLPLNDGDDPKIAAAHAERALVDPIHLKQGERLRETTDDSSAHTKAAGDGVATERTTNNEKELPSGPIVDENTDMPNDMNEANLTNEYMTRTDPGTHPGLTNAILPVKFSSSAREAPKLVPLLQKATSVSNPELNKYYERETVNNTDDIGEQKNSTTPPISPKRHNDGPLSASRAKLYSVFKSAKGIFASSASVSAQARLEMLTPPPQQPSRDKGIMKPNARADGIDNIGIAEHNEAQGVKADVGKAESRFGSVHGKSDHEGRKAKKEVKELLRMENELEKARAKEREKAAAVALGSEKPSMDTTANLGHMSSKLQLKVDEAAKHTLTKAVPVQMDYGTAPAESERNIGKTDTLPVKTSSEIRRPTKPSKDTLPRAKPAPVSIKVASQLVGNMAPPKTSISTATQEPSSFMSSSTSSTTAAVAPPASKRTTAISNKSSNSSLHTSASNNSLKSSVSSTNARPKALELAAKKREQEKKVAERKAAQKREMEQKRLARLEEERRAEQQRKAAEQQRLHEARKLAQRQAELRRAEHQHQQQQRAVAAAANASQHSKSSELNDAMARDGASTTAASRHARADLPAARPLSRMMSVLGADSNAGRNMTGINIPQVNPAKPAKRPLQVDNGDSKDSRGNALFSKNRESATQHRQGLGRSYQKLDAKRRKTNENDGLNNKNADVDYGKGEEDKENEEEGQGTRRSVMAPPIRHSNIRKDTGKFAHGYVPAPPAPTHAGSVFKSVSQQQQQHILSQQQIHTNGNSATAQSKTVATSSTITTSSAAVHHPNDMAKFSTAKIPFAGASAAAAGPTAAIAEPSNNPTITAVNTSTSTSQNASNTVVHATYKTPLRPAGPSAPALQQQFHLQHQQSVETIYPPSETITLPEIHTDSEDTDESSSNANSSPFITTYGNNSTSMIAASSPSATTAAHQAAKAKAKATASSSSKFNAPSWVQSPALRSILAAQQLVDPAQIFGPIAPLQMDEVFRPAGGGKGAGAGGSAKERLKKFRDRTSSANWNGADALTEEERRKDWEARERLVREGGWRFEGGL